MGESASFKVYIVKICPPAFAVGDDKEKNGREGKERYTKSQIGYISAIWGADPVEPISTKIGKVVGVDDVIMQSTFGFSIFRGFRSTGGQNSCFPVDLLVIVTTLLTLLCSV